jgi:hypothetical protein
VPGTVSLFFFFFFFCHCPVKERLSNTCHISATAETSDKRSVLASRNPQLSIHPWSHLLGALRDSKVASSQDGKQSHAVWRGEDCLLSPPSLPGNMHTLCQWSQRHCPCLQSNPKKQNFKVFINVSYQLLSLRVSECFSTLKNIHIGSLYHTTV